MIEQDSQPAKVPHRVTTYPTGNITQPKPNLTHCTTPPARMHPLPGTHHKINKYKQKTRTSFTPPQLHCLDAPPCVGYKKLPLPLPLPSSSANIIVVVMGAVFRPQPSRRGRGRPLPGDSHGGARVDGLEVRQLQSLRARDARVGLVHEHLPQQLRTLGLHSRHSSLYVLGHKPDKKSTPASRREQEGVRGGRQGCVQILYPFKIYDMSCNVFRPTPSIFPAPSTERKGR